MSQLARTLCNRDCPDACAIVATVDEGRVVRLQGAPDHPITRGFLCYRTQHFLDRQHSPNRLTRPLLRRHGELAPVSWDQALDFVAAKLLAIRAESGPAAILHYRSGGSLGLMMLVTEVFWERFGPVAVKRGDICSGAGEAAQLLDFGDSDSHDLADLLNSKQILLWGKNPAISSPHTVPILREARRRGAEVVLIDPVHHKSAGLGDAYYQVRPGGDFALAMAVAQLLFERGWSDPGAPDYCRDVAAFAALARSRSVEDWCGEAELEVAVAQDLARRLGPGRPAAILVGWGLARRKNGGTTVRALDALGAISGNLGIPGGGVSYYFRRRGAFATKLLEGRPPPRTICEPRLGAELLAAADPPVRAVWVTAGNPVAMLPESATTAAALRSRELVVVVDSFLTDTARCADVVLPTTTLLEADDLLGAYGHHYIGVARPVVEPPPEVKSDLEILAALGPRLGVEFEGDARVWQARLVEPKLGPMGIDLSRLEAGPLRNPLAPTVLFAERRFPTASGKVELLTAAPPPVPPTTPDWPLYLCALSTDRSQSSQWAGDLVGPLPITVHPDAAGGIADGEVARLESPLGTLTVRVRHDSRQRRDVALAPKGGHFFSGHAANALVAAELTDLGEGGALYDERVRLVPLEPPPGHGLAE